MSKNESSPDASASSDVAPGPTPKVRCAGCGFLARPGTLLAQNEGEQLEVSTAQRKIGLHFGTHNTPLCAREKYNLATEARKEPIAPDLDQRSIYAPAVLAVINRD